jgi:hypothetical protein
MKKMSVFLLLLLILSLSWFISCQKSGKEVQKEEVKSSQKLSNFRISTLPITQPSPNELVYEPAGSADPIDLLSIEYNTATRVVNSTMTLTNLVPGITYALSFNDPVWKVNQTTQIEQKAADLSNFNLPLSAIQATIADLEAIREDVITSASPAVLYSLSINISIFKTLARKAANPSDCNCTVHPSFLIGDSYFLCQEDNFYNKTNLAAVLDQYEIEFGQTPDGILIKQYVQSFLGTDIPFANVYGLTVSTQAFDQTILNFQNGSGSGNCAWWCPIGCGSDHGCCGNYEGCCLYKHILCYIHDKICVNCVPKDLCLPGCKPGSGDEKIPDPAKIPPTDPSIPDDSPRSSEYADYWNYLNAVKSWAIDQSGTDPLPAEYNVAELIAKINAFPIPSIYPLPPGASEPRFIYRLKNFVSPAYYFQYPGASSPSPSPSPF